MSRGAAPLLLVAATTVVVAATATTTKTKTPSVTSYDAVTPAPARQARGAVHPHVYFTTPQLIAARGYPAETHHVITEDGYILEVHRIPHGRTAPPSATTTTTTTTTATSEPSDGSYIKQLRDRAKRLPPHSPSADGEGSRQRAGQAEEDVNFITTGGKTSNRNSSGGGPHAGPASSKGRSSSTSERRVAFILHGFLSSSADFVMNDPDQAIGFLLADAGYDVWIGNNRGNYYGRQHVHLSPNQTQFWEYSWNEMASKDLPAMLSYVRRVTGAQNVSYIGHSMGTSLFFAMLDYHPHINSWIRVMAAMAPSAYIYHKHAPIGMLSPYFNKIEKELRDQGIMEILRPTPATTKKMSTLCGPKSIFNALCIFIHFIIAGPNANYIDREYLPVIVAHTPAGTGLRVFTHLMQLHASHKFQAFDYGEERNLVEYGRSSPPAFSLSSVTVPVGLFWSENDWIVHPRPLLQDVRQTASELAWVALNHRVQLRDFNHLDFLWQRTRTITSTTLSWSSWRHSTDSHDLEGLLGLHPTGLLVDGGCQPLCLSPTME
ncbi:LOW QUALITY PROTEIN: lipase lipl-4-like [Panulirus ornatus]|uniref:LOW QUALITY PROTEIN: lipase lipl-4-like n=1 Tax=Panulirus ornatus TaxID=150431 RepID=UPI003A8BD614